MIAMGDDHVDDIARQLQNADDGAAPPWYTRPEARELLAERDIGAVYRLLHQGGVSQREIARRTGQSQSEVSEIIHGTRQVRDVTVLERIADGLGVPRPFLRLLASAPGVDGQDGSYGGEVTVAEPSEEVSEDMKRRHFIAGLSAAAFGQPVLMGLLDPDPAVAEAIPLPSRLDMGHMTELRAWTGQLRSLAQQYGGQADIVDGVVNRSMRLLSVPGTDEVQRSLRSALAELCTVAGWTCFDSGLHDHARRHLTRATQLAREARDPYGVACALWLSGAATEEIGQPDDALKVFQLGEFGLTKARNDPRAPALDAWLRAESASAYAHLGRPDMARSALAAAQDGWEPPTEDERADMEWLTALIERDLGRLDLAEQLAASSVRRWASSNNRRDAALPSITLATIHIQAGESHGLILARSAIKAVAPLHSARARKRLEPLAAALDARPSSDAKELARMARQVAATRA